jgi:hypothetical protein
VDENGLGLWEVKDTGKEVQAELVNLFKNESFKAIKMHNVDFGDVMLHEQFCIVSWYTDRYSGILRLVDLNTGQSKELEGKFTKIAMDEELFTQDSKKNLYCFDTNLKQKWKVSLPKNLRPSYPSSPTEYTKLFLCGSNIIINAGVDRRKRSIGKIIALSQKNGKTVWEYDVDELPSSIFLVDDKLYITYRGDIIVLDGHTGKTILKEPSGFDEEIAVYPFNDLLFCFSQPESKLKIFSSDAKEVLQELKFPSLYYPSYQHGIIPKGDYLYACGFRTGTFTKGTSYGLIAVSPNSGDEPLADILPRVEMPLSIDMDQGEKVYTLTTTHDDIEDILRYGEIRLKETARHYGFDHYMENPKIDEEHTGRMALQVNLSKLPDNSLGRLKIMAENLEKHLKEIWWHPGAGKKYLFQIEIRPIK